MKVLRIVLQHKYIVIILWIIVVLVSLIRLNFVHSKYFGNENDFVLTVISKKEKDDLFYVELKGKEILIGYYESFPFDIGDVVIVKGKLLEIEEKTIPNVFNYKKYLQSREIYYQLEISEISLKQQNNNLLNKLKSAVINKIKLMNNKEYLYAFILGDSFYFDSEKKEMFSSNGIIFLLSIGAFQIYTISNILKYIKRKWKISFFIYFIIMAIVLFIYLYLTSAKIGVLKNGLLLLIEELLRKRKQKYLKNNLLLIISIFLLLINPGYLYSISFWYSFIIKYGITLLKKQKKKWHISIYAFILSIPLLIINNYEVNVIACLLGMVLFPLVNYLLFPLAVISLFMPFLSIFFDILINVFESINHFFYHWPFLVFVFRKPSLLVIIIYYLIIFKSLINIKFLYLFIFILVVHHNINYFINYQEITFLDVGQGDSILLQLNNKALLIDTGGSYSKNLSNDIMTYIKSLGISKITLILTHGDYDHMGEAIKLVNNFKVEKVIFNCGEFNDLEQELIKVLDKKKIPYYSCIKELNIGNNKLYFLQTKEYDNENDNSNVVYTEINGYKFMFMGDAGIEKERDILDKYNINNIDVLKVGHHGSKTSSSEDFINGINPKYSIISVGKNNRYGHPNKEALNTLEQSKVYRTDQDGSIMFKIKNNKLKIETCGP